MTQQKISQGFALKITFHLRVHAARLDLSEVAYLRVRVSLFLPVFISNPRSSFSDIGERRKETLARVIVHGRDSGKL